MIGLPELPPIGLMKIESERRKAERRERYALAVLPALITIRWDIYGFDSGPEPEYLASEALRFADALIAELDKK